MSRRFDVEICRSVSGEGLGWPEAGEAGARGMDGGFGGNRSYVDLRGMAWKEVQRIHDLERDLLARIVASNDPEDEHDAIVDELHEDDQGLLGLDLGVASAVVALSAARCIPFASCNGGAFGGHHHEDYPVVAFYARPPHVPLLIAAAEESGCGLEHGSNGCLVLFASEIYALHSFARALTGRKSDLRKLRLHPKRPTPKRRGGSAGGQHSLF